MTRVVSVHEYALKPGVEGKDLERAFREAEALGLFRLPGLIEHHLLRGIRGAREGRYAALWIYESREAWEALWGPVGEPVAAEAYPERWKRWEREMLAPLLAEAPDEIAFTSYEVL